MIYRDGKEPFEIEEKLFWYYPYNSNVSDLLLEYKKENVKDKKTDKKVELKEIPRFTSKEKKEFDNIEKDIEDIENKIIELEENMNASSSDYVKLLELQEEINKLNNLLEEKMERWEYLSNLNMQIENYRKGKFN